jgi:hypothetical protein
MNSISKFIINEYLIEKTASINYIWKKTFLNLEINQIENARNIHLKKVETILQISKFAAFYTDAVFDTKTKISIASCILYHDSRMSYKSWNLQIEISINDAELYAIEKATKWSKTLQNFDHIWIFIDNQNAIRCIENFTHFLANEIDKTVENLTNK